MSRKCLFGRIKSLQCYELTGRWTYLPFCTDFNIDLCRIPLVHYECPLMQKQGWISNYLQFWDVIPCFSPTMSRNCLLSERNACNGMNWPGGAAICLYIDCVALVSVLWCRNSDRFSLSGYDNQHWNQIVHFHTKELFLISNININQQTIFKTKIFVGFDLTTSWSWALFQNSYL